MRKYKHQTTLTLSLAVNYIIFLALACYTLAAVVRHEIAHVGTSFPAPVGMSVSINRPQLVAISKQGTDTALSRSSERKTETAPQAIKDIIAKVCLEKFSGGEASKCYVRLAAIAKNESGFNPKAANVTSREDSHGLFQLNLRVHKHITVAQAEDPEFSARWTLSRLISYGYPGTGGHDTTVIIQRHNGLNLKNADPFAYARAVRATALIYEKQGL